MSWGMGETSLRGRKVHGITSIDAKLARLALRGITILASAGASPNTHCMLCACDGQVWATPQGQVIPPSLQ